MNTKALQYCLAAAFSLASPVMAAEDQRSEPAPVVVELFTSQSCSSCVSAADHFRDLASRPDVIAVSWHVDYWNELRTRHGRWIDPLSSRENTVRQRRYNAKIRHRNSVYTPQIVIAGEQEAVGSDRQRVAALISDARRPARSISAKAQGEKIAFSISSDAAGAEIYLVTFDRLATTEIARGENAGVSFHNTHAGKELRMIAVAGDSGATFEIDRPAEGQGCAVFIQQPDQGAITSGAYCPM